MPTAGMLYEVRGRRTLVGGDVANLGYGFNFGSFLGTIGRGVAGLLGVQLPIKQVPMNPVTSIVPLPKTSIVPTVPMGPVGALMFSAQLIQALRSIGVPDALLADNALAALPGIGAFYSALKQSGVADVVIAQAKQLISGAGIKGGGRRRRRMNVCNPRALARAGRRVHSFTKLARQYVTCGHGKGGKLVRGFRFKKRRK